MQVNIGRCKNSGGRKARWSPKDSKKKKKKPHKHMGNKVREEKIRRKKGG